MITENEFKILKNIVLSEFPILKCYDALNSDKWVGWKPNDFDDIYKAVGELIRSVESDNCDCNHLNLEGSCSSAGFFVGFVDGYFVISWSFNSLNIDSFVDKSKTTIDKVRKKSYIYTEIDCIEFLRMYKIYKLWQKNYQKGMETATTQGIINSPQE